MSRLRIFPPVAIIYPNDRQLFTAQAEPPPPMWTAISDGGDIGNEFGLYVDAAGSQTGANGAHQLFSGLGIIEVTIDDQSRPSGAPGQFSLLCFVNDVNGFIYFYALDIFPTSIQVRDENGSAIYTEAYTTVSGDIYRIELAAGFRLYRNGILKHSRVNLGTTVIYPMRYAVFILEPTVTGPTKTPTPRLIGDWKLHPGVTWTAPSHGSVSTTGQSLSTEYSGGTIPGTYTLTGAMEPASDAGFNQRALATIIIPPLQILGNTSVTLQPGQKTRFKTNYDSAQTNLITRSVIAGPGSFSQDEFTAGTAPGISVVRATASANGTSADITVTVAPVITNASNFTAAKASEQIDFDTNLQLAPTFVSAGIKAEGIGAIVPGLPQGLQPGDIMLLFVETANEVVAAPSGWAATADSPQGTGAAGGATSTRLDVFWKRATPAEVAPTVADPGDHAIGQILAFRGCINTGNPWDVTSGDVDAVGSTSVSIPGDTTTVANCLVVLAVANATDTAAAQTSGYTNANLVNLTERTDINSTQGNGGGFAVITGEKAAAGAYAATTATLATSSVQGRISIALKPGTITFAASIGSINSSSGLWTAPSQADQEAIITATNGTITARIVVPVLKTFPIPRYANPMQWRRVKTVLSSQAEDGTFASRVKNKNGRPLEAYEVRIALVLGADLTLIEQFWDEHHPGKRFIFENVPRNIRRVVRFDSDLAIQGGPAAWEVAFRVREVA